MLTKENAHRIDLFLPEMDKILKFKINDKLRFVVKEIKKSIQTKDYDLVRQLSAVKSVTGKPCDTKKDRCCFFWEDQDYNNKKFNDDAYGILDTLHFEASTAFEKIPSGITTIGSDYKIRTYKTKESKNSALKLVNEAFDCVHKK